MIKTQVIEVKAPPTLVNPAMQQGIRDSASAKVWAEKRGYQVVYFLNKKQRVYAERSATNGQTPGVGRS